MRLVTIQSLAENNFIRGKILQLGESQKHDIWKFNLNIFFWNCRVR